MLANQVFAKKCRRCSPLPRLLSWCLTVRLKPNTRVEYSLLKVCGISAAWAAWLNAAYRGVKMIKSAKARFQGISRLLKFRGSWSVRFRYCLSLPFHYTVTAIVKSTRDYRLDTRKALKVRCPQIRAHRPYAVALGQTILRPADKCDALAVKPAELSGWRHRPAAPARAPAVRRDRHRAPPSRSVRLLRVPYHPLAEHVRECSILGTSAARMGECLAFDRDSDG